MVRRILVGLGATAFARSEVLHAVELAQRYNAELTGVTVVDLRRLDHVGPVPIGADAAASQLRSRRHEDAHRHVEEAIATFVSACREAGVRHHVKHEERADAFDLLISEGRYHDLVVLGLHGVFEGGLLQEAPGEASETLARLISSGVRPIVAVAEQYRPIRKVLIAYSGSMESAKTMKQFAQFRPWLSAAVRVVVFNHTPERASRLLRGAEEFLHAHGIAAEVLHVPGLPHDQILPHAADWNADLIVLGNSAKNLMLRRVLGETALRVMRAADRPLFLSQ